MKTVRQFTFILSLSVLAPLCGPFCQNSVNAQEPIGIKVSVQNEINPGGDVWDGWGTSLCWWANRIGYNDRLTERAASLFFDKTDGLGLNIMRYNIGGGDDPSHHHITRTDSDIPGWQKYDAATGTYVYDYSADARQLAVLKAADQAARDESIVEVFSNSPPYFMTVSGCTSGNFRAAVNNLKQDRYTDFAQYLAHVTNHIVNNLGIKVTSVSPMNEPNTDYWSAFSAKQEGCHFDAGKPQCDIIVETRKALDGYGLENVIVAMSDETNPGKQIEEIQKLTPEARKAAGRINAHTYGTNEIVRLGQLTHLENMSLWMSEVDGNGVAGSNAGEMASGLWLADKIISDITALKPSAWVLWQVIDTHVSKDGYDGRHDKGPLNRNQGFWGLAWANHDDSTVELTQKYYSFGQFTRYIRPGARVILCPLPSDSRLRSIAAVNSDGSVAVVIVNLSADNRDVSIDLSELGIRRNRASVIRTRGDIVTGEHWNNAGRIRAQHGLINVSCIGNSVSTILVGSKLR